MLRYLSIMCGKLADRGLTANVLGKRLLVHGLDLIADRGQWVTTCGSVESGARQGTRCQWPI